MNISFYFRSNVTTTMRNTNVTVKRDKRQAENVSASQTKDQLILSSNPGIKSEKEVEYVDSINNVKVTSSGIADDSVLDESATTFPDFAPFQELIKHAKVVDEHYAKVNEENRRFANPLNHIQRKYYDRTYPYYVEGLTNEERSICSKNEEKVYLGLQPSVNSHDPIVQETFGGIHAEKWPVDYNQGVRDEINASVNQLFKEHGIVLPEGTDLLLTVDPYENKIHAGGVDEELAEKIENALNKGKNGYNLYSHLLFCNPANAGMPEPPQYSSGGEFKSTLYQVVKEFTGYDIRELENRDGKFFAPDGRELWDVLTEKYNEFCKQEGIDYIPTFRLDGNIKGIYNTVAAIGWENYPDKNLSIGYKDGFLYDIDTEHGYGPGQTAWIDQINQEFEERHKQYQEERLETIRYEERQPNHFDLFRWNSIQVIPSGTTKTPEELLMEERLTELGDDSGTDSLGLIGIDGKIYPMRRFSDEILESLTRSLQKAEWALSKTILHLPDIPGTNVARRSLNVKI